MENETNPRIYPPEKMLAANFLSKSEIIKQNYKYYHFELASANNVTFLNCDFSFSRIKDSYFRNCKFIQCNFTGSKISDSNFRNSTFDNCNISFTEFKNTLISLDQLLHNLPQEIGIKLELIRNLKKNYEGIGNRLILKEVIKLEIFFSKEEHFLKLKSFFTKDDYYSSKYDNIDKKLIVLKDFVIFHLNRLWGHGEFAYPLIYIFILTFLYSALLLSFKYENFGSFCTYIKLSLKYFLGLSKTDFSPIENTHLKYLIPSIKILLISFAISIFSRRHSWR